MNLRWTDDDLLEIKHGDKGVGFIRGEDYRNDWGEVDWDTGEITWSEPIYDTKEDAIAAREKERRER